MAPIIAAVFVAAGFSAGAASVAASVTLAVISFGVQAGVSRLQAQAAKKAARRNTSTAEYQQSVRGSVSPRVRHYGKVKVGGVITFIENIGSDVYLAVAFGTGTITAYEQFFVGDKAVLIDVDGAVTNAPFWIGASASADARSHVRIQSRRGYADQTAFSILTAAFPTQYTADHKMNGIAAVAAHYKASSQANFAKIYNSGIPDIKAVIQGAPVWDPRDAAQTLEDPDTWEYSRNPALVLLDYLMNPDGARIALGAVDVESFAAAADLCDVLIPLRSGGSEPRYRCSGAYTFDEQPAEIVRRITDTCHGEFYLTRAGKIGLRVPLWTEPAITLGEDDIVSLDRYERGVGLLRQYNTIRPIFTSPDHGYQEIEAEQVSDPEAVELLGREFVDEARYPWVTSHSQAQRLAKIELYEENPEFSGEMTCHLTALDLIDERVFRLLLPGRGIDLVCRVTGLKINAGMASLTVSFESLDPRAFEWVAADDEGDAPAIPPETTDDSTLPSAPNNFTVSTETDAVTKTGIRWQCRDRTGQVYDFRWRPAGGEWTQVSDLTTKGYVINPITSGADYDAEARVRTAQGGISPWGSVSFTADDFTATSLDPPTALAATGGAETVEVRVTQSASVDAWALQYSLYPVAGSPSFSSAAEVVASPASAQVFVITAVPGSYLLKARAISLQGSLVSAETAAVAVTITEIPPGGGSDTGTGGDGSGGPGTGNTGAGAGSGSGTGAGSGNGPNAGDVY